MKKIKDKGKNNNNNSNDDNKYNNNNNQLHSHSTVRARACVRTQVRTRTVVSHNLWANSYQACPHARMGVCGHARGQMRAHALVRSRKAPSSGQHAQSRGGPNQLAMQLARVRTAHNQ